MKMVITSIDKDGTGLGVDYELFEEIADLIKVPLIIHGGIGNINQLKEAFNLPKVDAVCVGSILHYHEEILGISNTNKLEGNTHFIKSKVKNKLIRPELVENIKREMNILGYGMR